MAVSYSLEKTKLKFHTPELQVIRQECRWTDMDQAPLRRALELLVELNYPLAKPIFSAALANGTAISMYAGEGARIVAVSDPLVRPAEDSSIKAVFAAGSEQLLTADAKLVELAELANGAECELPVKRSDWDKTGAKQTPTVNPKKISQTLSYTLNSLN